MLRTICRLGALLLPLLFGIGMAAYAATSHDDTAESLRAFLYTGEDCPAPCWQGIRPGVTRSFEAVARLERLPWVTNLYTVQGIATSESYVRWEWTGDLPAAVDAMGSGQMWVHDGRVYAIDIPLAVKFSEVWSAFGAPETEIHQTAPVTPPQSYFYLTYFGGALVFRGSVLCPLSAYNRLGARLDAHFSEPIPADMRAVSDPFPCPTGRR